MMSLRRYAKLIQGRCFQVISMYDGKVKVFVLGPTSKFIFQVVPRGFDAVIEFHTGWLPNTCRRVKFTYKKLFTWNWTDYQTGDDRLEGGNWGGDFPRLPRIGTILWRCNSSQTGTHGGKVGWIKFRAKQSLFPQFFVVKLLNFETWLTYAGQT